MLLIALVVSMTMCSDHLPFLIYLVAGQQHAIICQIMLLTHDPRMPVLGLDNAMASKAVEDEIRRLIRQICGIAHSAGEWQPATIAAGMTVAMCKFGSHIDPVQHLVADNLLSTQAVICSTSLRNRRNCLIFSQSQKRTWAGHC